MFNDLYMFWANNCTFSRLLRYCWRTEFCHCLTVVKRSSATLILPIQFRGNNEYRRTFACELRKEILLMSADVP